MASILLDNNTQKWYFIFSYSENGKWHQFKRRGFKTKREAHESLSSLQKEIQEKRDQVGNN